ncbi:MAG: DnaA regulatory inactivator Hda [Piscirickettsiaceae bacterium]|nr:MAG: DnaA regulatory inactivator Hda [Piscirickettsiaceae bacterium]PCH85603.1 MAG: DnaA regulatory inactivator Hda [Piscirickettsiaceae bacterium]
MHPQLPLPFRLQDDFTFNNFISSENQQVISALTDSDEPFIFLWGDHGTGKTHLLQAICQEQTVHGKTAVYLPLKELVTMPAQLLIGMDKLDVICLDDIELINGKTDWEEAVFNLFNQLQQTGGRFIVSSTSSPQQSHIQLNDLKSRLNSGLPLNLAPLSDDSIIQALQARAHQLGLELNQDTANFLMTRFPRKLSTLWGLLEQLDHASLAAQRKLTIPFLKSTLSM